MYILGPVFKRRSKVHNTGPFGWMLLADIKVNPLSAAWSPGDTDYIAQLWIVQLSSALWFVCHSPLVSNEQLWKLFQPALITGNFSLHVVKGYK